MMREGEIEQICLNKFYDFFSLLYDSKMIAPFSQFIERNYINEFKK